MKNLLIVLFSLLAVSACIAQEKPQVVPGNLIVQVPNESIDKVVAANQFYNGQPTELKLNRLLSAPMAAYLLEFNEHIHHEKFLQQVWSTEGVTLIQFNHYIDDRSTVPDDPQLNQQWWHVNAGGGGGTADADIDSDEAWDITTGGLTATGDTIVVCVVDDGGDLDHPDLIANNWINYNEIPNNNIDDDGNGYVDDYLGWNPEDDDDDVDGGSHGVNVAGMIGAVGNNGTGVVGVNWDVKIMNMTYANAQESNVIEAYTYPLVMRRLYESSGGDKGAFVVATNSSWGINYGDPADAPLWCAFYDTLGESGILSAGATANLDINIDVEGDLPTACSSEYLLSVTASNNEDVRTFSGYGQTTVDLAAPGEDVRTTSAGGGYTTTSGTSFATPATAGAIALMYSAPCASLAAIAHSDPSLAAEMVRDALFNGVDPVSNLTTECVTGGRLNLKGALDEILGSCSSGGCLPPFSLTASGITDTEADIEWGALAAIDTFNISYGVENGVATDVFDVTESSYNLTGLTACTDYWFVAQSVCDGVGSDWSDTLFFQTDGCCEAPNSLVLNNILENGVTASWGSVLAANSYLLQWRPLSGGAWTQENNISGTTFNITNLDPCTEYEVQVATNCDGNVTTDFTSSQEFITFGCGACTDETYCESFGSNTFEWIGNVTVGSLDNDSDDETDGYGDYTSMSVDLQRGTEYAVSFSPEYSGQSYTEHFRVWIDLNQNGSFTNAELLYDDNQGSNNTVTGTITIPLTAELGSTRMRVSMAYGTQFGDYPQNSCDEEQDGEVEDYCVNILEEDPVNPGINELSGTFGMEVFPVPASENVTIRIFENDDNATEIRLLDATGQLVKSIPFDGLSTQQIDISSLAKGVYLVELHTSGNEIVGRERFVKN